MKLLTAKFVVPVTSPIIEAGAILIDGGLIRSVGPVRELRAAMPAGTPVDDLGDVALLPGFVNPHTHLELTNYQGVLPRAPLWEWFNALLPMRATPGAAEREIEGVREGARQSLAAGVTLIGDISRRGITALSLRDSPIRRVCFIELISGASLPPSNAVELATIADDADRRFGDDRTRIGITPHAPYTVTPADLQAARRIATDHHWPLTMHLLETVEERDWLHGRAGFLADFLRDRGLACANYQPTDPVAWLSESGIADAATLFAHLNYADQNTIDLLANSQSSVVYCPRAHEFFGHTDHPWRSLLSRGINVCVGTDSLASNVSLSILDELRFLAARYPDIDDMTLLEMGTIRASRSLRLERSAGHLSIDAWADACAIPCVSGKVDDVVDEIINGNEKPVLTWVAGTLASTQAGL
ncbi:MAG: amidohydrolase family protein [Phycisphaerales bacterium]|nr:amidohydrolase family protein [Phycisphaerales bacterium]MCB9863671.1 amidohydrolase family protein [Phycisphaerales bacterium]